MISFDKTLPPRIAAYSMDRKIRTEGRLALIQQFREKASFQGSDYIENQILRARLYIHELGEMDLREVVEIAQNHLERHEFLAWMKWRAIDALREEAFSKAALILELARGEVEFSVDNFVLFTPELLKFLESERKQYTLTPFTQMNWHNGAGVEGFKILLNIAGAPAIKQYIRNDRYEKTDSTYIAIGAMCEEGLLENFFDRETLNLISARRLIQILGEDPHKIEIADIASRYSCGILLEMFATEARLGNRKYQEEALATLLPFLTYA